MSYNNYPEVDWNLKSPINTHKLDEEFLKDLEIKYEFSDDWPFMKKWITEFNLKLWYKKIIEYVPNEDVIKEINNRLGKDKIEVQKLSESYGSEVNIDFYYLTIETFPSSFDTASGTKGLLHDIRRNLNIIKPNNLSDSNKLFTAYSPVDEILWNTSNPKNCVMSIFPGWQKTPWWAQAAAFPLAPPKVFDDMTVLCTEIGENNTMGNFWNFSTIWSTKNQYHPVSGNRVFGLVKNNSKDNSYRFYTAGVDGFANSFGPDFMYDMMIDRLKEGDKFWRILFSTFEHALTELGGKAVFEKPIRANIKKNDLSEFFNSNIFD